MYKRILLCYDGSAASRCALREGTDLIVQSRAEAHVLAIVSATSFAASAATMSGAHSTAQEDGYRRSTDEIVADLCAHGVLAVGHVSFGVALERIPYFARELSCDLIIVGHKSRSSLGRWWTGGENVALADRSPCSILISIERA
jgi:nucleotide-binding universal stress UspA family protein